ncbi:hypothetical protein T03_3991 [Trichinella britovi]|uniref:Uncharacterized protein n=1 Tax=Trichinella britovi TaxID=45882 RepID=A0A0V1D620_TRIBR|nr:hypothetical protein T03_3991 [Trichinella britovi]
MYADMNLQKYVDPVGCVDVEPYHADIVTTVQIRLLTMVEPPAAFVKFRTVSTAGVLVPVAGAEAHAVVFAECVTQIARIAADVQRETVHFGTKAEICILGDEITPKNVDGFDFQNVFHVACHGVDVPIAEPEVGIQLAEAVFVTGPILIEIHTAVQSTLNYRPTAQFILHITIDAYCSIVIFQVQQVEAAVVSSRLGCSFKSAI